MTKLFARWLPFATLATWSAVLLYFYLGGRLNDFLHPTFRPYVLLAGIALGVMALVFLLFPVGAACCAEESCGHAMTRRSAGQLLTFFILLVPIGVASFYSPDSFGKTMMQNRRIDSDGSTLPMRPRAGAPQPLALPLPTKDGTPPPPAPQTVAVAATAPSAEAPSDYLQHTPEGYIIAEVLDLLYAAQDSVLRKDFEGRKVQLIGQLMPDQPQADTAGRRFKAVRMFMTCCAADARPVATLVSVKELPDIPEMTWIKITGTSTFPIEKGRRTAVLEADRVEKVEPPEEMMLY